MQFIAVNMFLFSPDGEFPSSSAETERKFNPASSAATSKSSVNYKYEEIANCLYSFGN